MLSRYGGHAAAAGFEVAAARVAALQEKLAQAFQEQVGPEPPRPTLKVDAQVQPGGAEPGIFQPPGAAAALRPGQPSPVFVCRGVECLSSRVVAERHLKVQLHQKNCVMEAIAFDQASQHPLSGEMEVAFSARLSHYKGRSIPELMLLDWGKP